MRALEFTLDLAGIAGLGYGAWLAYPPAGFMVAGSLALIASILMGRARSAAPEARS